MRDFRQRIDDSLLQEVSGWFVYRHHSGSRFESHGKHICVPYYKCVTRDIKKIYNYIGWICGNQLETVSKTSTICLTEACYNFDVIMPWK